MKSNVTVESRDLEFIENKFIHDLMQTSVPTKIIYKQYNEILLTKKLPSICLKNVKRGKNKKNQRFGS